MSKPDEVPQMLTRTIHLRMEEGSAEDGNVIRLIASTDEVCDWGYYREQLLHGKDNVDVSGAHSLLSNHNTNKLIGGIKSISLDGKKMVAEVEVDPAAEMETKLKYLDAIKKKYLRGVSIGYSYNARDCDISDDQEVVERDGEKYVKTIRTVVVRKWILREITVTPTPADLDAGVLREGVPEFVRTLAVQKGVVPMDNNKPAQGNVASADEIATERAARLKLEGELKDTRGQLDVLKKDSERAKLDVYFREVARTHNVEVSDELLKELGGVQEKSAGLEAILKAKSAAVGKDPLNQPRGSVVVSRDAADKVNEAAEDALMALAGIRQEKDLGMRSGSGLDIGRRWMNAMGVRNVLNMNRDELADCMINGPKLSRFERRRGMRDAANVSAGMFSSFLLTNVMDNIVYQGFEARNVAITYDKWVKMRRVDDFLTYTGAALDIGNLEETGRNEAFNELAKEEGGYSDKLGMWGATHSLDFQTIQNDRLGQFLEVVAKVGFIVKRTIDKKVYTVIDAQTWTGRTTAGNLSDDNVDIVRTNLGLITGPAGVVLGLTPRYLIVPSGLRSMALKITQISASLVENDVIKTQTDLLPIITPFLPSKTTRANSKWYLATDTMFDPVVVATLAGVDSPIIEEYDAGAVAARKWKFMFPFKVTLPAPTIGANSYPAGMWQGAGT
jgi:hypothetical protein